MSGAVDVTDWFSMKEQEGNGESFYIESIASKWGLDDLKTDDL